MRENRLVGSTETFARSNSHNFDSLQWTILCASIGTFCSVTLAGVHFGSACSQNIWVNLRDEVLRWKTRWIQKRSPDSLCSHYSWLPKLPGGTCFGDAAFASRRNGRNMSVTQINTKDSQHLIKGIWMGIMKQIGTFWKLVDTTEGTFDSDPSRQQDTPHHSAWVKPRTPWQLCLRWFSFFVILSSRFCSHALLRYCLWLAKSCLCSSPRTLESLWSVLVWLGSFDLKSTQACQQSVSGCIVFEANSPGGSGWSIVFYSGSSTNLRRFIVWLERRNSGFALKNTPMDQAEQPMVFRHRSKFLVQKQGSVLGPNMSVWLSAPFVVYWVLNNTWCLKRTEEKSLKC